MHQTKTKLYCVHSWAPNSLNYSTDSLDFQFSGVRITSPAHAKGLFKIFFGHNYFTSEPIFNFFVALFTTFGLQNDDISHTFLVVFSGGGGGGGGGHSLVSSVPMRDQKNDEKGYFFSRRAVRSADII